MFATLRSILRFQTRNNVKNQVQIIRGYDYQVDVAIWAHKHSYDRMWPVYNYTVFNKKPMPYVNSKASFYEFFVEKFVLDFNGVTSYYLQNCGPVCSCPSHEKANFWAKSAKVYSPMFSIIF